MATNCPVCDHAARDHDGAGCTAASRAYVGQLCTCVLAVDMPGQPYTPGALMPRAEGTK